MMRAVEMYNIIILTLMTTTLGLPQTCLNYCKLSPEYSTIPLPDCDCSLHNLRKTRSKTSNFQIITSSEIKDRRIEPAKQNSSSILPLDERKLHMLNLTPSLNFKQYISNNTKPNKHRKTFMTNESVEVLDKYNEHDGKSSHKYKTREKKNQDMIEEIKELPLHLYLDINIDTPENSNSSQLEQLKNMFENFQAAEEELSECINLHIYIFSKYIDTINKTNTNWGHKGEYDNLSSPEELTEIQKKCGQPASIIKQSIYQIKESVARKEQTSELVQEEQETIKSLDSNTRNNINATNSSGLYPTLTTYLSDDDFSVTSKNVIIDEKTNNVQSDKTYTEQDDLFLVNNNYFINIKNSDLTSTSPIYNDPTLISITKYEEANVGTTTELAAELYEYDSKMNRTVYNEEDLDIPRIITKELSNGTFLSKVDGHEEIPNSDFNTNSIISTTSDEISNDRGNLNEPMLNPELLKTNTEKNIKSDFEEIHGNLYFMFGKKQIPARFIQQSHGELNVAIDGYSLCDQMLEENTSNFMNLLCHCIRLENCTYLSL